MGDRLWAGKPSQYVTIQSGKLKLSISSWVGIMSTSKSWNIDEHKRARIYGFAA